VQRIYLLGLGGVSTTSASGIISFFLRSFALFLGTLIALGFFVFGDCDFFGVLKIFYLLLFIY